MSAVQFMPVQYTIMQCSELEFGLVQCSTLQFGAVQYNAVQYSAVQCSTVPCPHHGPSINLATLAVPGLRDGWLVRSYILLNTHFYPPFKLKVKEKTIVLSIVFNIS